MPLLYAHATGPSSVTRVQQEAPQTLRGQRGRRRNVKGEPQIFGSFPSPRPRPLFPLVVVFMVGLGEPQPHAKFEVPSVSRCTNIKGNLNFAIVEVNQILFSLLNKYVKFYVKCPSHL